MHGMNSFLRQSISSETEKEAGPEEKGGGEEMVLAKQAIFLV